MVWARTGELFYRNEARDRLLAVSVTTQPTLRVGVPKEVLTGRFSINNAGLAPRPLYDVAPDGSRFLTLQDADDAAKRSEPRLVVVQNWDQELKRLVRTN